MKIWEPKPPGTLWATPALLRDCFYYRLLHVLRSQAAALLLRNSVLHFTFSGQLKIIHFTTSCQNIGGYVISYLFFLIYLNFFFSPDARQHIVGVYFTAHYRALASSLTRLLDHTHNDPPQSVRLLWTSDQSVAETSTWQHTTITTDKHPCPGWDSNPQSQQTSGRRPTP